VKRPGGAAGGTARRPALPGANGECTAIGRIPQPTRPGRDPAQRRDASGPWTPRAPAARSRPTASTSSRRASASARVVRGLMKQGRIANRPFTFVLEVTTRPRARMPCRTSWLRASRRAPSSQPAGRKRKQQIESTGPGWPTSAATPPPPARGPLPRPRPWAPWSPSPRTPGCPTRRPFATTRSASSASVASRPTPAVGSGRSSAGRQRDRSLAGSGPSKRRNRSRAGRMARGPGRGRRWRPRRDVSP